MSETVTPITKGFDFSYKAFENTPVFIQGVRKIYNCDAYPSMKSAYRIKRLCDSVQQELKTYLGLRQALKTDAEDYEAKLAELHEMIVPIKWGQLEEDEVTALEGLSPVDLMAIEPLVSPSALESVLS